MLRDYIIKYSVRIITIIIIIVSTLMYLIDVFTSANFDIVNEIIIQKFLIQREGILVSIAAIFIGIHFGLFTLILSLKNNSKIAEFDYNTFKEIVHFIICAFFSTILYLIYALIYPLIIEYIPDDTIGLFRFISELILATLFTYMTLTALQVALSYILIFKEDIKDIYSGFENDKVKKNEHDKILQDLKVFLREEDFKNKKKQMGVVKNSALSTNPKKDKF